MQHALQWVGIYVGLNLLLNLFLAVRVSSARVRSEIMTGEGEEGSPLYKASRAHILNVEYTPIGLAGLITLYILSASIFVLHAVGILLTLGRLLHALGLMQTANTSPMRMVGTLATWAALLIAALGCLAYGLRLV